MRFLCFLVLLPVRLGRALTHKLPWYATPAQKAERTRLANRYERVIVITEPHHYFAKMPYDVLVEEFGLHARTTPDRRMVRMLRLLFALVLAVITWSSLFLTYVIFIMAYALITYELLPVRFLDALIPMAVVAVIVGIVSYTKWYKVLERRFAFMQPLWWVKRVTHDYTFKPVYIDVHDPESHVPLRELVDVQLIKAPRQGLPLLLPVVPRPLVEEVHNSDPAHPRQTGYFDPQQAAFQLLQLARAQDGRAWDTYERIAIAEEQKRQRAMAHRLANQADGPSQNQAPPQ